MMRRIVPALAASVFLGSSGFCAETSDAMAVVKKYCFDCHDAEIQKGDLNLEELGGGELASHSDVWEQVIRKMNARA